MSKLYDHYKLCKEKDPNRIVLIKSGTFYVMLDEDAEEISKLFALKLTPLNENIKKCGFPVTSIEKYKNMFDAHQIEYTITSTELGSGSITEREKSVIDKIRMLDINTLSPMDALITLEKYQSIIKNG